MNKKVYKHLSEKSGEKILEWKKCRWTGEDFPIFEKEVELMEKISPVFDGKSYNFQLPKLSPKARAIKRMLFRNERSLYKRKSDLSGENILSIYPENFDGKVYSVSEYNSDEFEPMDFGINFDENKNIGEQIKEFYKKIPKKSTNLDEAIGMENCDYCNFGMGSKNSYMCQVPIGSENCFYSYTPLHCTNIIDGYLMTYSENCYNSIGCFKCYKVFYSQNLVESSDCYFSFNLKNCKNCIGCVDLIGKDYHIFNKKIEKNEFEKKLENIFLSYENVEKFKKEFEDFKNTFPKQAILSISSEKCFGNGFQNSNNVLLGFDIAGLDNGFYNILSGMTTENVIDTYSVGLNVSMVYNSIGISNSTKSAFGEFGSANNSYYFRDCRNIENCLFSYGLRNKEFCIFNKQYTEDEYNKIVPQIIKKLEKEGMWGEFFETENSDFPYNDSVADIFYPVKKLVFLDKNKNILKTEINYKDGEGIVYILESDKFISKAILDLGGEEKIKIKYRTRNNEIELPKNMQDVILCEKSKRPFRLLKQEKEFYKKYNIPNPKLHPDIRFKNRINKISKFELFLKECENCKKETLTSWEKEKIICEGCYKKEIY